MKVAGTAHWWSSTAFNTGNAWYRSLNMGDAIVVRYEYYKFCGFSVRCVMN